MIIYYLPHLPPFTFEPEEYIEIRLSKAHPSSWSQHCGHTANNLLVSISQRRQPPVSVVGRHKKTSKCGQGAPYCAGGAVKVSSTGKFLQLKGQLVMIISRWWFQTFVHVHPYLGKSSNLTDLNFFQMGWFETTN